MTIKKDTQNIKKKNYSFINLFKILKSLFSMLKNYKFRISISIIFTLISTSIGLLIPLITSDAINLFFYGFKDKIAGTGDINFEKLLFIIVQLCVLFLVQFFFNAVTNLICTKISKTINFKLRNDICHKIYRLPSSYFEKTNRGEVLSLIINDSEQIGENISEIFVATVNTIYLTMGSIVLMFLLNIPLTVCALILVPIGLFTILFITKKSQKHYANRQNITADINSYIEESLSGLNMIRIFNKKEEVLNNFQIKNNDLYEQALKGRIFASSASPLSNFFNKLYYIIIVVIGAYLCLLNLFTVGEIQAFIRYLEVFNSRANAMVNIFDQVQRMAASYERISNFLNLPDYEMNNKENILSNHLIDNFDINRNPIIQFENVNFAYTKDSNIINNFSLDIYKGETIAIVGPTGAGKTTLIKLLLRFYDSYNGNIKLYGHDIKSLNFSEVRKQFGVVLQNIWLYFGPIEDNIKFGNPNAKKNEVIQAAKISRADKFIELLPDKFKTWIFEGGVSLSYGQIQLLAIARAIASKRDIIILDEATSNVDTKTEQELFDAFDNLIEQKTSIIIAHRLSTIISADKIVVINNGDIVEIGNHKELMSKKGFYYDIYKSGLK